MVKGAVAESKRGNTSLYEPLVSQGIARRSAVLRLLDQAFGGAVEPFLSFLVEDHELSPRQRRELIEILEQEDSRAAEEE